MKTKKIFLTMLAIWLSYCLARADGLMNNLTNKIIKIGDYTAMRGTNGHFFFVNPNEFWNGVWKEDSNGWRVQLRIYMQTNYWIPNEKVCYPVSTDLMLSVQWGSAVRNSGGGYYMTPNGKFAKFELLDSKGNVILPNPNAGTNLLIEIYNWYQSRAPTMSLGPNQSPPRILYENNLPAWVSPASGSLVAKFPKTITTNVYPCQEYTGMIGELIPLQLATPLFSLLKTGRNLFRHQRG